MFKNILDPADAESARIRLSVFEPIPKYYLRNCEPSSGNLILKLETALESHPSVRKRITQ